MTNKPKRYSLDEIKALREILKSGSFLTKKDVEIFDSGSAIVDQLLEEIEELKENEKRNLDLLCNERDALLEENAELKLRVRAAEDVACKIASGCPGHSTEEGDDDCGCTPDYSVIPAINKRYAELKARTGVKEKGR